MYQDIVVFPEKRRRSFVGELRERLQRSKSEALATQNEGLEG